MDITEVTIKGGANEIAALVLNLQVQQSEVVTLSQEGDAMVEAAIKPFRDTLEGTKN